MGESHVLPLLVKRQCILIVFERVTERDYRLTVINTNPEYGLKFHAVKYDPKTAPKVKCPNANLTLTLTLTLNP